MADKDARTACKYGVNCYQRNQAHKDRFSHPSEDQPAAPGESERSSPSVEPPAKRRKSTPPPESHSDSDTDVDEIVLPTLSDEIGIESASNGSSSNGTSSNGEPSKKNDTHSDQPTDEKTMSRSERCSEFIKENFDKGPHAQRAEHQKLIDSPAEFISSKFLVQMPDDFFAFWSFCEAESKNNSKPENLFKKFGLSLVGPFDVLAKKFDNVDPFEPGDYLRHWRFYYDPPEFQVRTISNFVIETLLTFFLLLLLDPNGERQNWHSLWILAR